MDEDFFRTDSLRCSHGCKCSVFEWIVAAVRAAENFSERMTHSVQTVSDRSRTDDKRMAIGKQTALSHRACERVAVVYVFEWEVRNFIGTTISMRCVWIKFFCYRLQSRLQPVTFCIAMLFQLFRFFTLHESFHRRLYGNGIKSLPDSVFYNQKYLQFLWVKCYVYYGETRHVL